ncbi:uncharacterized protein PFLUO_LOCUS992 [Penicillium psychrofluorescens]|uniref:uncharacterized protein n=1 Tax=Penicillium psychrofluorescens TaxID=3158075 RepID=UPI003CCD4EFC
MDSPSRRRIQSELEDLARLIDEYEKQPKFRKAEEDKAQSSEVDKRCYPGTVAI